MRVLMLSLDRKILDSESAAHKRMKEYSPYVDELFICIPGPARAFVQIASNIYVQSNGGATRLTQFFRLLTLNTEIVQEKRIDIVTTQDPFLLGFIGYILVLKFKIAFNVQLHGVFFKNKFWFQENFFNRFLSILGRFILKRADSVRVVSEFLKGQLINLGIKPEKIIVAPVAVDLDFFKFSRPSFDLKNLYKDFNFIFITASRFVKVKNLHTIIKAFAKVASAYPKTLLLLIGEGQEEHRLKALVNSLNLSDNVRFVAWSNDIVSFYKGADYLVFPSVHESFGMAPLEALSSGCPVILSKVGWAHDENFSKMHGIKCVVKNEENEWARAMLEAVIQPAPNRHQTTLTARLVYPYSRVQILEAQKKSFELAISNPNRRKKKNFRLLFITQRINSQDDDLAFVIQWIDEWRAQGAEVKVICLKKGVFDNHFPVYSLGKEKGAGKFLRLLRFFKYIFVLKYDRVFVHMNPEYVTLGGWFWWFFEKPIYLWYTHYTQHIHLKLSHLFCKRLFAATAQSMPMYQGSKKRVIVGHGIDLKFWDNLEEAASANHYELLAVHRLCRSKRLELGILALKFLSEKYSLTVYGPEVEKDYVAELRELVKKENLEHRVKFMGPVPMAQLKQIYPKYSIMVNMASETIDKTMLEGMLYGIYPVTTKRNAHAIGLQDGVLNDTPEAIADFILNIEKYMEPASRLKEIVKKYHNVHDLISKMNWYVARGV